MTRVITATNVNEAFTSGFFFLRDEGIKENSRNGPVLVAPGPVITEYLRPKERILWNAVRDCNPTFHLMESIWMLAGGNHVGFPEQFNARFKEYAEPSGHIHGAYGFRWRNHWGMDQLPKLVRELRKPGNRRAVLGMWDPRQDLEMDRKDVPCNTHAYFDVRDDKLNMTVCCRSNDMLWGAYGANVVHFSILQEIIAGAVGVAVGVYRQFSNNFHLYTDLPQVQHFLDNPPMNEDRYATGLEPEPLLQGDESWEDFLNDCYGLVFPQSGTTGRTAFFRSVAMPMLSHYLNRKEEKNIRKPHGVCGDWGTAYTLWLSRREGPNG